MVQFVAMCFLECEDISTYCSYCVECFIKASAIAVKDTVDVLAVETDRSGVIVGERGACVSPGGVWCDNVDGDGSRRIGVIVRLICVIVVLIIIIIIIVVSIIVIIVVITIGISGVINVI